MPLSVDYAFFYGCTAITSVSGLPMDINTVDFTGCTSLTSVAGIPDDVEMAYFNRCTRLRRIKRSDPRYRFDDGFDPAQDVHTLMVSGLSNKLLNVGIGPDVALLIARFVTPGMTATDRMETMQQVKTRYFGEKGGEGGTHPLPPAKKPG